MNAEGTPSGGIRHSCFEPVTSFEIPVIVIVSRATERSLRGAPLHLANIKHPSEHFKDIARVSARGAVLQTGVYEW